MKKTSLYTAIPTTIQIIGFTLKSKNASIPLLHKNSKIPHPVATTMLLNSVRRKRNEYERPIVRNKIKLITNSIIQKIIFFSFHYSIPSSFFKAFCKTCEKLTFCSTALSLSQAGMVNVFLTARSKFLLA